MRQIIFITLLVGLAASAPTSNDDKLIIDEEFFPDSLAVYTADHDIIKILVPLNKLNVGDSPNIDAEEGLVMFFVEADKDEAGNRIEKGLYVFKNNVTKKLLDDGRDIAADNDESSNVAYFAAKDGLYVYNNKTNEAEKFGTITEGIISVAKVNSTDVLYIITEAKELFKVTEKGTKKEKLDVDNAQQIVLDFSDNLYFYNKDKDVYVKTDDKLTKIEGLPANRTQVTLLNPPFVLDDGIPVVVDDEVYIVFANGTSTVTEFKLQVKPSAYSAEGTLIQYYAYDKKIYEYNVLTLVLSTLLEELAKYLQERVTAINHIASRPLAELTRA